MHTQTSYHTDSVRRCAASYFPKEYDQPTKYRPALNVKNLIKLLKKAICKEDDIPASAPSSSRKRSASGSPLSESSSKRRRTSPPKSLDSEASEDSDHVNVDEIGDDGDSKNDAEDSDDSDWCPDNWEDGWGKFPYVPIYPLVEDSFTEEEDLIRNFDDGCSLVPIFRHIFELQYTKDVRDGEEKDYVDDHIAQKRGWDREESELMDFLKQISHGATEPTTIELGRLWLCRFRNRYVALSSKFIDPCAAYGEEAQFESNKWFSLVPSIPWPDEIDFNAEDYIPSDAHEDMLQAFRVLGNMGRATLKTHLRLVALPSCACDPSQNELPFRLQIEITASFVLPAIFKPIRGNNKRDLIEREDVQRRLLSFLFPPSLSNAPNVPVISDTGSINIPFFYSILAPAPSLRSTLAEESLQPKDLLPTLLPFQRRSVGWMLEREGKIVNSDGMIIPNSSSSDPTSLPLPLFWDKIESSGGDIWYIHRLTGVLSLEVPAEEWSPGGILAEEPGLGKTLECIAVIMLNPAPERNPTISYWDDNAKITLKEIKTTLIVTPPSLASQWADELALHAPTLKVFVYNGWSKLEVPITEYDVELEENRRKAKRGISKGTKASKSGRRKGRRSRNPTYSDDEDDMDVDESAVASDASEYGNEDEGEEVLDWCSYINTFDVCITTYNVLRQDFTVARAPPIRPRRIDVMYSNVERARSPLVMCEWYRVIMDEVQMVGGGKTEEMVSLIPRISSFAVSGTPARAQVSDLKHVLKFLRVDSLVGPPRLWNRLLRPGFVHHFAALFRRHAIRTMKSAIKDELTIPQQTRYLVGIDLGRVERHVYDQNFESALLELGLDARGVAASAGWEIDAGLLRSWLRKLRGICTHPQVGQLQRQGDKLIKSGALKSIGEVLDAMRDQNWRNFMDDWKTKVQILTRRAQLQQHDKDDHLRYQHALETLLLAEKEANKLIEEIKTAIADHEKKGDVLKKEAFELRESRNQENIDPLDVKGKGKAIERDESEPPSSDEDAEDYDLPKTPAGQEHGIKRRALQQRLRESNVTLHRVKFLQGDVYHVLGGSHTAAEDAAYAAAEEIRRSLLRSTESSASRAMANLLRDAASKGVTEKGLLIQVPYCGKGGIRSADLMDEANQIINGLLNEQSKLLWQWRTRMHALLTRSLKEDGDADGEEYSRSLDSQGEADMYLQAYTALLADRRAALVAERTLLAAHDGRERKVRKTKAAKAATAAAYALHNLEMPAELRPEHEVLFTDLTNARKAILEEFNGRAIKSITIDLNAIAVRIHKDDLEKDIVKDGLLRLRQLIADQGTLMEKLDADLAQFRKAFNERILYFRQLQEISDSVAEVTWDYSVAEAIEASVVEQNELEGKINTNRARQRFLNHLAKNKEDGMMDEDDECCILCRCEFKRGYITACAHVFCEPCMNAWTTRKDGKTCPVCRVIIHTNQLQRFTVEGKDKDVTLPPIVSSNEPAPRNRREILYNRIDRSLFEDIQTMESFGSYGSKIQALVRHLLYLQVAEPDEKSIVFSAWADSLHIIEHALKNNGISCLRIDQSKGKQNAAQRFCSEPDILVLLLHGERENAGLNVTCASRVFLVESVVHHGFEVQAIARIDRMGQKKPTEVYCYYAEETVERNILDLAARQGLSLYTQDNSAGTLNVMPFALDAQKKADSPAKKVQKGDFIFKTDDMLAILFPFMYFYEDYMEDTDVVTNLNSGANSTSLASQEVNAVAGPSRMK